MSWSEGREKHRDPPSPAILKEKLRQVDAVLQMFSKDEDLQDDLKMGEVKRALKHWTGESRLPPEEALMLQDHRRVVYVLQRLQILQQVCREAGIKVPLDLMLKGCQGLPEAFVANILSTLTAAPSDNSIQLKISSTTPAHEKGNTDLKAKERDQCDSKGNDEIARNLAKESKIEGVYEKSTPIIPPSQINPFLSQIIISVVIAIIAALITVAVINK